MDRPIKEFSIILYMYSRYVKGLFSNENYSMMYKATEIIFWKHQKISYVLILKKEIILYD
jgi:hypothetical protein